jgi:hypothetical protein
VRFFAVTNWSPCRRILKPTNGCISVSLQQGCASCCACYQIRSQTLIGNSSWMCFIVCSPSSRHVSAFLRSQELARYRTVWLNGSVAVNSNFLLDILYYVVITWRWPLKKAETCRDHGEHTIKHIYGLLRTRVFVLWFGISVYLEMDDVHFLLTMKVLCYNNRSIFYAHILWFLSVLSCSKFFILFLCIFFFASLKSSSVDFNIW